MIDQQRMESIVRQACRKWNFHRDIEDLKQIGRIAYWSESCCNDPDPLAIIKVRRRVIDGWRSMNGSVKDKHGFLHGSLHCDEELLIELASSSEDEYLGNAYDLVNIFKKNKKIVASLIIEDLNKQSIAKHLNVHPSRVSQLLADMRKQLSMEWFNA